MYNKILKTIRTEGLLKFLQKAFRLAIFLLCNFSLFRGLRNALWTRPYLRKIDAMLREAKADRIIVWRSTFGWTTPLYQRPQHISLQLSQKNCLVIYEVTAITDAVFGMRKMADNLFLVNFQNGLMSSLLLQRLKCEACPKYLQFYSTEMRLPLAALQEYVDNGFRVLYEYIDDLHPVISSTATLHENIIDKYRYVMEHPEHALVVVTADDLERDVRSKRGSQHLAYACNGVEYAHFAKPRQPLQPVAVLEKIAAAHRPIVGYYGALAEWFDFALIDFLARRCPEIEIVLIGVLYDNTYKRHDMTRHSNVHFLGAVPYAFLPQYATYFDVCMIPFVLNEVTNATSPIKLFEYMALGKPIVTTAMHECKKYASVMIADSYETFADCIERALRFSPETQPAYFATLKEEALQNTWESKAGIVYDLLVSSENAKGNQDA